MLRWVVYSSPDNLWLETVAEKPGRVEEGSEQERMDGLVLNSKASNQH